MNELIDRQLGFLLEMFIYSRNWIHESHLDKRILTYLIVHLWLLSRVFYNLIRAAFWRASNCTGVVFKSSWRRAVYWKACVQDSSELPTSFIFLKSRLLIGWITWYPVSLGRGSGCFELRSSLVCVLWWHTRCLANQPTRRVERTLHGSPLLPVLPCLLDNYVLPTIPHAPRDACPSAYLGACYYLCWG